MPFQCFLDQKNYVVNLPYELQFNERKIPTKARPIQINQTIIEYYKKEINDLIKKN